MFGEKTWAGGWFRLRETSGIVMEGLNLPDLFERWKWTAWWGEDIQELGWWLLLSSWKSFFAPLTIKRKVSIQRNEDKLALSHRAFPQCRGCWFSAEPGGLVGGKERKVLTILKEVCRRTEGHSMLISSTASSDVAQRDRQVQLPSLHQGRLMLWKKDHLLDGS